MLDGAHNPDAAAALAQSLPELLGERARPLALVMGVLEDKDAASMLRDAAAAVHASVVHRPAELPRALAGGARSRSRASSASSASAASRSRARRSQQAQEWARGQDEHAPAAVLATGSVYLVGDLLAAGADRIGGAAPSLPQAAARSRGGSGR